MNKVLTSVIIDSDINGSSHLSGRYAGYRVFSYSREKYNVT